MRIFIAIIAAVALLTSQAYGFFNAPMTSSRQGMLRCKMALDQKVIDTLTEMKGKYDRLKNVVSPEAENEAANMKETVEKFDTYSSVKTMLVKLRMLYLNEASEQRKAKQLKSFIQLYEGQLELEEVLKEKLGLPHKKGKIVPPEVVEMRKYEEEVDKLEKKLKEVEVKLPQGMSTIDARFGY